MTRTLKDCSSVRRAMSSANVSMETPACTRRTFRLDDTSLSNGMSRASDREIFASLAVSVLQNGPRKDFLSSPEPVHKEPFRSLPLQAAVSPGPAPSACISHRNGLNVVLFAARRATNEPFLSVVGHAQ
jgi:hypothetical protein